MQAITSKLKETYIYCNLDLYTPPLPQQVLYNNKTDLKDNNIKKGEITRNVFKKKMK